MAAPDAGSDSGTVDAGPADGGVDGGPSCTVLDWDPAAPTLQRWPEPALVVEDATTETGLRLQFEESRYPDLTDRLSGYREVLITDLGEIDGFGVTSEAYFTFGRAFDVAAVPSGDATASPSAGLGLVVLEPGTPRIAPVIVTTTDDDRTLLMAPMQPLPPHATVVAFVTRALTAAARGCLEPSAAMASALAQPDAELSAAISALAGLGVISTASDLVAVTVYPTESIEEDTLAVAADVATRDTSFVAPPACVEEALWFRCEARFGAEDYRDDDGVFRRAAGADAVAARSYEVPVTIWLPKTGTPPYRTLLFGHGLGGDRDQAEQLAEFAAPLGYATVCAPALMHGDHPTHANPNDATLNVVLGFFGIGDLRGRALEANRLRDHFRQTTWDRLQLTRLLRASPDVDGDGTGDIDPDRLAYLGVSLGGLMGPELLAASDAYGAGVLVVPGGRVSTIMSDSAIFSALVELLRPRGTSRGDVRRFFPILQTILDKGDPASYGPHILEDRFDASRPPSILVGVVLDDDVVPNVANYTLGRALRVPIVEPLLRAEPGFAVVPGPISGNFASGAATGGLLQFDLVGDGSGGTETATHSNIGDSDVGVAAWLDFLATHWDGGLARVRDPYAAISFPRP